MADAFAQLRAQRVPAEARRLHCAADVQGLRSLREEARLRQQPEPLDGGHEAALQPEPPARPRPAEGQGDAGVRLHPLPQGRQGPEGRSEQQLPACGRGLIQSWRRLLRCRRRSGGSRSRTRRWRTSSAASPPRPTASSGWRRAIRATGSTRDRLRQGITRRRQRRGGRHDRAQRRRRVRAQPGRGRRRRCATVSQYEVERLTGLRVAEVEVRIQDVRGRPRERPRAASGAGARRARPRSSATAQRIDDLNVYPGAGRRHGHEPDDDRTRRRRELEQTNADDRPGARQGSDARRADGRTRQLGRDPLADHPRRGRDARRGGEDRRSRARASVPVGARDAAYRAVRKPVEGTMLSVIRELADEASAGERRVRRQRGVAGGARPTRRGGASRARRSSSRYCARRASSTRAARGCWRSCAASPRRSPARSCPPAPVEREELSVDAIHQELSRYRYCTTFVIEGEELDATGSRAELEQLGDSLLVVGDAEALKVHVHTDEPGTRARGRHARRRDRAASRSRTCTSRPCSARSACSRPCPTRRRARRGVVAVVAGDGNRRLFESLGATKIVEGGQTMNPSTAELVAAIEATPAPTR